MQTAVLTGRTGPESLSCSRFPRAVESLETFLHLGISASPGPLHWSAQLVWVLLPPYWDTGAFKTSGPFTKGFSTAGQGGLRVCFVMLGPWGFLEGVL